MNPMVFLLLLISLLIFLALTIGVFIFFVQRLLHPDPSPIQSRLNRLREQQQQAALLPQESAVSRKLATMYKSADYQNMSLGRFLEQYAFINKLKRNLHQADIKITVDRFFMQFYVTPIAIGILIGLPLGQIIIVAVCLLVPVVANLMVNIKKKKRQHKFTTQLPDALNLMTSSLRAGHSFQSALTVVASELSEPLSTEFAMVVKDFNLGMPVREALTRLMISLDGLSDVRMFVTAVLIQRESGGNLAEILDKLGYTIRERFKLKGQVSAMTGQSRLTGYCLGAAPIAVLGILLLISPGYVKPLFEQPLGHILLGVAFVMQLAGFFIIKRIVDIRV